MSPRRFLSTLGVVSVLALAGDASAVTGFETNEARLLGECGPAVRGAGLIVEAIAGGVLPPGPDIEVEVTSFIKGEAAGRRLEVRMAKAPHGRWPREGESRILCLVALADDGPDAQPAPSTDAAAAPSTDASAGDGGPARGGRYELATHHGSILPATDAARKAVRGWMQGKPPRRHTPAVARRGARLARNPYLKPAAASDSVLVGTLADVRTEGKAGSDIVGSFNVDEALLGYGAFKAPISVHFGAAGNTLRPGRYVLFVAGSRSGRGFVVVKHVKLSDDAAEAGTKHLVLEALGARGARLTTIQATLAEWQDAWNSRDAARCILCYSRRSRLRKRYASGDAHRRGLQRQIDESSGTVAISIERIRVILAPTAEGAREAAEVDVVLELTPRTGAASRERATMQFVSEAGEWLILREGF